MHNECKTVGPFEIHSASRVIDPTTRQRALALELFESLLRIASQIDDAETFASEAQGDRGRAIVYQNHIEMMKEQIERADTILADVLATKGGE